MVRINFKKISNFAVVAVILFSSLNTALFTLSAGAATNVASAAKISFTFDDGLTSAYTQAAPTLAKYGLTGTDYVITGCVGMTTTPNTCHANNDNSYMTWDQIMALKNTYGWDIGSHTKTHPLLASSDATDGQPNVLTAEQVTNELTQSKADLAAHGIDATDFSTPCGDYNTSTLAKIAKIYASHRGFADVNNNNWPYNDYLLNNFQVQGNVSVAQVKAKINEAIANKTWLIITMHDIRATKASKNLNAYQYATKKLDKIAAYVKTKQTAGLINNVNINQGLVTGTNMFANGSFNDGINDGWSTDSPSTITADSGNNGSYPDPTNSIKLVSANTDTHLFSPKVDVDPGSSYMFKNFLNVSQNTSGEVAFYVDEYDAGGNWISGQYKTTERSAFVENMNFVYTPSSVFVKKASLQVILTAGSGVTAYLDNAQMIALNNNASVPSANPINLMTNSEFDNGINNGWTTNDPTNIVADNNGNGASTGATNSVLLTNPSTTNNHHLFSPKITVDPSKTYSITSYLNLKAVSNGGEVAFYIDEYDRNGNWVSGQYKTGVSSTVAKDVTLSYTPSATNVASASLQVIVTRNSTITAYIDNIRWYLIN